MLMLTSAGFNPQAALAPTKPFQQIAGWPGEENRRPMAAGSPYTVVRVTPSIAEPRTTANISCTIFMFNSGCETIVDEYVFQTFCRYIKYNIEATWSTSGNTYLSPQYLSICSLTMRRTYDNTGTLRNGEIFIAVKEGEARSFIEGDGRAGVFYVSAALNARLTSIYKTYIAGKKVDTNPVARAKLHAAFDRFGNTTPAHEFGHVLGLADRYAHVGYVVETPNSKGHPFVIIDRGHTVPVYIHAADPEYSTNYRWLFNLMSTQKSPIASTSGPSVITWDPFDPTRNAAVTVQDTLRYAQEFPPSTTPLRTSDIGITAAQLACVANGTGEAIPGSALIYLKKISQAEYSGPASAYVFDGTFVGIVPDSNGNAADIVHDDGYDVDRNHPSTTTSQSPRFNLVAVDSDMEFRRCIVPPAWNGLTALSLAGGLVGAALDVGQLTDTFLGETETGSVPVPARLTELMDVVNLDARLTIRRFVGDYVQQKLNSSGALRVTSKPAAGSSLTAPPPDHEIRYLDNSFLSDIRKVDGAFTPKTDLFADVGDVLPDYPGLDHTGLLVPYDYPGVGTFRKGATRFHRGPAPTTDGVKIHVHPAYPIIPVGSSPSGPGPIGGRIYGTNATEIAAMQAIWDAGDKPVKNKLQWPSKFIMDYDAEILNNRRNIIALKKNGAVKDDKSRLDPSIWTVDRCFSIRALKYIGPQFRSSNQYNKNTEGRYLVITRKL